MEYNYTPKLKLINCGIYHTPQYYLPNTETQSRIIQHYEIELFLEDGIKTYINGQAYSIKKGGILICRPGNVRKSITPFKCFFLYLNISTKDEDILSNFPIMYYPSKSEVLFDLFNDLIKHKSKSIISQELHSYAKIFQIIGFMHEEIEFPAAEHKTERPEVKDYINYVENNYNKTINVDDIAEYLAISPNYFIKIFKEARGITPYRYLINYRIDKAKKLLLESKLTLAEIAEACGFETQSYFSYVFKKEVLITPGKYRLNIPSTEYLL